LRQWGLAYQLPGDIKVNPALTAFLDGGDGLGGYADVYAYEEYTAPGTKLEMELERRIIKQHLSTILSIDFIKRLKDNNLPLVIVEGGAGPDLRTYETVSMVLSEKKRNLMGVPIRIVITDISKRMAALTSSKLRRSSLVDPELNVSTAVLAADVFELIENLQDNLLTYALLPFGVLSFGLDSKEPGEVVRTVQNKLLAGGGMLATVYHSDWVDYSNRLKKIVYQLNMGGGESLRLGDLAPFVIDIKDGKMQVADGLAFNCQTFKPEDFVALVENAGFKILDNINSPAGWAYWPKDLLNRAVHGRVFPEGCPLVPPPYLMDRVKKQILNLIEKKRGDTVLLRQLTSLIPDGKTILEYAAPYITLTAKKPVTY